MTDDAKQKLCCIFEYPSIEEAVQNMQFEIIEDYGDAYCNPDGSVKHYLHTWDDGYRRLVRCTKCGSLFLYQSSEFHSVNSDYDRFYSDYYPVSCREEARMCNEKYNGYKLEEEYSKKGIYILKTNGKWSWLRRDRIIEAAKALAKELHQGQTDKAGKDYFSEHLCTVAEQGNHWMEKVAGYLHDAAEDTQYEVKQIMQMLKERCGEQLLEDDAKSIDEALNLLNSKMAASREEYITHLSQSEIAVSVKLNDLKHNMDLTRIKNPTEKDFERVERYKKEYEYLMRYKCFKEM